LKRSLKPLQHELWLNLLEIAPEVEDMAIT